MDVTAASMMYSNPFYAPNYSDNQQPQSQQHQHQIFHASHVVGSAPVSGLGLGSSGINAPPGVGSSGLSPRTGYSDLYRFEDGSGDASGSLMLGQDDDDLCGGEETSLPVASTSTAAVESLKGNVEEQMAERSDMMTERGDEEVDDEEEEQEENREVGAYIPSMGGGSTSYMVFPRTAADFMPRLPLPRHSPYMIVGQEQYVIQPDTVFVLGMRLNVTKNDIITYFGRLGLIKMDEASQKPKIFVYKNKQTGRSKGEATITYVSPFSAQAAISCLSGAKFMGQVLTVLPAYLSTRQGSLRFNYPRELNSPERQRRQRALKWKPASDNWVCTLCRNSNFVWRSSCNRCQATKVSASGQGTSTGSGGADGARSWRPRKDDWPCGFCFNLNFWYREKCNRCHSPRSDEPPASGGDKPDPWELVLSTPPVE
ncbi:uncharacterized protein LOC108140422 [Drosophila elegans]|uniref:uncharacterized protein LOC108140422 n=1 Tax=Drosophila elegans TaxID=30023 RepID=UPI0007E7DDF4|nr:uncharacterized protein LOC108140422 [Drosophila elegans]